MSGELRIIRGRRMLFLLPVIERLVAGRWKPHFNIQHHRFLSECHRERQ